MKRKVIELEKSKAEKKSEPKHSIKERLQYEQAEIKKEQKAPQHQKQNMER